MFLTLIQLTTYNLCAPTELSIEKSFSNRLSPLIGDQPKTRSLKNILFLSSCILEFISSTNNV